jgi:hypothetical protein
MADDPSKTSKPASKTAPAAGVGDEKKARLEQALRANLRRRNAQSRARAAGDPAGEASDKAE